MKLKLLAIFVLFVFSVDSSGQIAAWDFTGVGSTSLPTHPAAIYNSGLDAANTVTRGATAGWSTAANSFRTVGFKNDGIATSNTDYFQITLSATSGNVLSLSTIDARFAGTASFAASPGVSNQFAYSLDGTTFNLISSPQTFTTSSATLSQINLSGISALQNVSDVTTITIRYYASGQTTTGGWGFNSPSAGSYGLAIGGSITPASPAAVPVVTPDSLTGTVGTAFSYTVSATNPPIISYSYTGTLPGGLSLNTSTGVISGTPTTVETQTIAVTATNATGTSTPANITIAISLPPPPVVSGGSPTGTQGSAFTYSISATNSPTSYAIASGTLPAGLSLNTTTGVISGTPTSSGSTTVTVTATNSGGTSAPATLNFSIAAVPVPVVTGGSASGTVGTSFSYAISATNSPTGYAIASGTLPNGLSLNTTTGVISGSPSANGSFSVTVTATNGGGTSAPATINFTIAIASAACYTTNFETVSATIKTAYSAEEVLLDNNVLWFLDQCLVATSASDYKVGSASLRMKNDTAALFEMDQDQADGVSTISFSYRNYNTDVNSTVYAVEYSKDSGASWINIGNISPTASIQTFGYTLNQAGPVRIHVKYFSGLSDGTKRFNLDDLVVCNYNINKEIEVTGNSTNISNGSTTVSSINNTDYGDTYFVGDPATVKTFTITNRGTGTLTLSSLSITPTTNFTVSSGLSSLSLTPGQTSTFSISFSATDSGTKNAVVTIANDDADESPFTFTVSAYSNSYTKCNLQAKSTIAQQDFESAPASPVLNFTPAVITAGATVSTAGGSNYGQSTASTSPMYIGAQSYQVKGAAAVSWNTLTSGAVDASLYRNIKLSFNLGAYGVTSVQGLETKDQVIVSISEDGGTTWYKQIVITGNNNAIWDINNATGATRTRVYDSATYVTYAPASQSANTFSKLFTITNLPNSAQLAVKFDFKYATKPNTNEIFALDNVIFEGQLPQTSTWTGSWDLPPTSTSKAIIAADYNMALPLPSFSACDCQVNSGKTLTITSGKYIEIQSNIKNNGTITVENNGSLVQIDDAATNTGDITFKRDATMKKFDYVYWSSPVQGFSVTSVSPTTSTGHIWKWLPTIGGNFGNWTNANETMVPGKGYIVRGPVAFDNVTPQIHTAVFTGFANTGRIDAAIERGSYTGADYTNPANNMLVTRYDDNWNLIGNPYPSAINAKAFMAANTNIEGVVRLWTHGTLPSTSNPNPFYGTFLYNYATSDYLLYNATGATIQNGFNGNIAAGQGFFVAMVDGSASTETVTFTNALRSKTYANNQFFRTNSLPNNATDGDADKSRIWLDLVGANAVSRTLLGYVEGATDGIDRLYDAHLKLDQHQSFYSLVDDDLLNIQGKPLPFTDTDVVPLGFKTDAAGSYKLAIAGVDGLFGDGQPIYLEDKLLNIIYDLKQAPYDFTSEAGQFNTRFVLRYTNSALATENFQNGNHVIIATGKEEIKIRSYSENISAVNVYDVLGREIFSDEAINESEFHIKDLKPTHQTLIIKIKLANGQTVTGKTIY